MNPLRTALRLLSFALLTVTSFHSVSHASTAPVTARAANAASTLPAAASQAPATRLVVWSRGGASTTQLQDAVVPTRASVQRVGQSNLHITELPSGTSAAVVRDRLQRHPHVRLVEEDRVLKPGLAITDPYQGSLWHLERIGATAAWNITGGKGITIAIVDTGVDSRHPDLVPNLVPGWNVVDNNSDTSDLVGHGTAVAGVAAAAVNNGLGVAGLAGQSRVMPVRVAGAAGSARMSDIAKGIIYAADQGVRIVNVSYAGVTESFMGVAAAQYLKSKGGLLFVAAGNNGIDEGFQATRDMIPVAATNAQDQHPSWASSGPHVALSAPGEGIWTTATGGQYQAVSGSSFASPLAAGLAALMLAANPKASAADIESWMMATAKDLGAAGRDAQFGIGRIDAAAAVLKALNTPATPAILLGSAASTSSTTTSGTAVGAAPQPVINAAAGISVAQTTITAAAGKAPTPVWQVVVRIDGSASVARVDLKANDVSIGSDTAAPFAFVVDPAQYPRGVVRLVATAYDAAGRALGMFTMDQLNWENTTSPVAAPAALALPVRNVTGPSRERVPPKSQPLRSVAKTFAQR